MVRVLAVSDVVEDTLWADAHRARGAELIVACGDLPFEYLGRLMNALDAPLVFVPGNHDPDLSGYQTSRAGLTLRAGMPVRQPWPDGAIPADGAIVTVAGLRVAGLGGCRRYGEGPNQYSDRQFGRRAWRLTALATLRRQRVDVLLTHAPPRGVGDGEDAPHRGFTALHGLVRRLRPAVLLHGHVDPEVLGGREHRMGATAVRNVTGWQMLTVDPVSGAVGDWMSGAERGAGRRRAR